MIQNYKTRDTALVKELGITQLARVVGYDSFGSPIELVFDLDTATYEWHIGGEYVKDASPDAIDIVLGAQQCTPVGESK